MISKMLYRLIYSALIGVFLMFFSCKVEPTYYSEIVPETFVQSEDNALQLFYRPFTHLRWYLTQRDLWRLQELGTDEFCVPQRGTDFTSDRYTKMQYHQFDADIDLLYNGFYGSGLGVALALNTKAEINRLDFSRVGISKSQISSMNAQLNTLMAYFYLQGLDLFGGMPLYSSNNVPPQKRSSAKRTFDFIDSLLNISIPNLPKKENIDFDDARISQAAGALIKARLYFNAHSYIKQDKYDETSVICQDIIDGKYGNYEIDADWTKTFGFSNNDSREIIWSLPSDNTHGVDGGFYSLSMPYNYNQYLGGLQESSSSNGECLLPSRKPNGDLYDYRLGGIFERYSDGDVRKEPYVYEGGGKYSGMFVVGDLINPKNPSWKCVGAREYRGEVLNIVDQISLFSQLGSSKYPDINSLPSDMHSGEENSGVRLMKISPRPDQSEPFRLLEPQVPILRLAEVYYTLAECKMRLGDKSGAAKLINTIRERYFEEGNDLDKVTVDNLDKYRMLSEWSQEFVGEWRRRTDLVRWDAYVNEDWWDHKASHNEDYNLFPIPARIMGANPELVQNPGYK